MGLRRGLDSLPGDRETQSDVRELLLTMRRHRDEWLDAEQAAVIAAVSRESAGRILRVLDDSFVLDCDGSGRYRLKADRLVEHELDVFVRRVDTHHGALRDNVTRFRERYGR
ncbi:MAG: hypothetical protein C0418_05465 [Coriobacteriaceae bacterium]|nr:hypothetical protein [Coriobacteriaceae bacterium]